MEYELILLAAGFSRRFGGNKLMYQVEGKPLYLRAGELLLALKEQRKDVEAVRAVTRYPQIQKELERRGIKTVLHLNSEKGISSSVQAGLQSVLEEIKGGRSSAARGFCFFVGDQPYLRADTVSGLLDSFQECGKGIGRLCCRGKPGSPAVFSERYIPELLALTGDQGGRQIMKKHPEDVWELEIEDGSELWDLDRPPRTDGILEGGDTWSIQ